MMRDRRRSASMCAAVISRGHPAEQFRRVRGNSPCLLRENGRKPPDPTQAGAKSSVPRVPRVWRAGSDHRKDGQAVGW
jgi:hypothetical protein